MLRQTLLFGQKRKGRRGGGHATSFLGKSGRRCLDVGAVKRALFLLLVLAIQSRHIVRDFLPAGLADDEVAASFKLAEIGDRWTAIVLVVVRSIQTRRNDDVIKTPSDQQSGGRAVWKLIFATSSVGALPTRRDSGTAKRS